MAKKKTSKRRRGKKKQDMIPNTVSIIYTEKKGRCLIAAKDFSCGTLIFVEKAWVHGTWHSHLCIECDTKHDSQTCDVVKTKYSLFLRENLSEIEMEMCKLPAIKELDRARQIIKLFIMFRDSPERVLNVLNPLSSTTSKSNTKPRETAELMFSSLLIKDIIPNRMTLDILTKLICQLNTNSHELENIGGSGLFKTALLMEHNCLPNCSFSTDQSTLYMCAIRDIKQGEALSIDYLNYVCAPTSHRQRDLMNSYGFLCQCQLCSKLPEISRGFQCKRCKDGLVYFQSSCGVSMSPPTSAVCSNCSFAHDASELLKYEATVLSNPPTSLENIEAILKDRTSEYGWYERAVWTWRRVITAAERFLPIVHYEKSIYHDHLAQVLVAVGKINEAKLAWTKAYEMSVLSCGLDVPNTKALSKLVESTPTNLDSLQENYKHHLE